MSAKICVVGSLNMDLVVRAERFPEPGETLLGGVFATHPGGKGANQAVAAARLGAEVAMIGCVGEPYGAELIAALEADGVDATAVERRNGVAAGVGCVTVVPSGENAIVVASGANALLDAETVERHRAAIEEADVVVLQLETTDGAVDRALHVARQAGTRSVLNAAPAKEIPERILRRADVLVVNRGEARTLGRRPPNDSPDDLATALHVLGAPEVVVTLGPKGAIHSTDAERLFQPGYRVAARDTTGCGDAFVGAWAVAAAEGLAPAESLRLACGAGAAAAEREGAIPSLPDREAVERVIS